MDLGAGFFVPAPLEVYEPAPPTLDDLRNEQILLALASLREALLDLPRPEVHVSAPDLSEIVTAVASLKPGADAQDVAAAVVRELSPLSAPPTDLPDVLEKLTKALDRLDFRLKGIGGSTGGGGVGSTVKNEVGTSLDTREAAVDSRYEWQAVAGSSVPLYIGTARPGTPTTEASWRIEKYGYVTGPAGDPVPAQVQTAVGAWDSRAEMFS